MAARMQLDFNRAPEWMAAEMPPGYQTRLLEIQRLSEDLQSMDRVGRVLWEKGEALRAAVGALVGALKCEVDGKPDGAGPIAAKFGDSRRLLLIVADAAGPIQKTNEVLARAFEAVQFAAAEDRVVLVAGNDHGTPPADRTDPLLPDALDMLRRMGVGVVTTAALFKLWRLAFEDPQKARQALERLHAQDGGLFTVPAR